MKRDEMLMREYETITAQIIHWDAHMWHKSQFFLAIESVFLAVVFQRLTNEFAKVKAMNFVVFLMIVAAVVFNVFICYVWFRTNRSNREYLSVRFERALQIEKDPAMNGELQLYQLQKSILSRREYKKHSSSLWEIHLPTGFVIAWMACAVLAAFDATTYLPGKIVGGLIVSLLVLLFVIEKTGWPAPIRTTTKSQIKT